MSEATESGTEHASRRLGGVEELLARDRFFAAVSREALRDVVDACELVDVPGGTCLLRAGEPLGAMLAVVHGALRVRRRSRDGAERTVREFYRGDLLGVMGMLSDRRFPVDPFAIRDSTLLRLPRARFLALTMTHPSLLLALAQMMGDRAFEVLETVVDASGTRVSTGRGGNLALLPLSDDDDVRQIASLLLSALGTERALLHVDPGVVDAALGPGSAAAAAEEGSRVTAWMSEVERDADVVVYECDPQLSAWTARCVRQSDRLVVVTSARQPSRRDVLERVIARSRSGGLMRPIDLVLVHDVATTLPSQTRRWRELPELRAVHHVRHRGDVARAARRLVGRPTGLVLSGGGARGIAHVGVIAALAAADIPIDYVCGTSMGAIFAASLALGFDVDRIRGEVADLFARPFALYDLTLPISSLLAGKRLDRVLHHQLGDADIEDLWLPFSCVSTDLAHAKLVVHERGCLWKSVRASCSIPGIFPPLPLDGATLVDGGLVDNLPLDLMLERCNGPIVAVDVFPYGDPGFEQPRGTVQRWLRALRTRVRGEPASPPLFDILMRSTLVGSKVRQRSAMGNAADVLYLEPPVADFGPLQWRSHRALFDAGYEYAAKVLASQRRRFPNA